MQVHPSQIQPGESYDAFYFIRNHTDSTTYYVKAVVYDVRTGEVLDTSTLTQSATNSRLFIKTLQAPPDPVGYGRNIVAIATVYTDSSYTTKSEAYEEQEQYFLVKSVPPIIGGGGIDARTLRDIVQDEVEKGLKRLPAPPELKVPDQPDMSFVDGLFGTLGALQREVNRIPKEGSDLSSIQAALNELRDAVKSLPTPQKTDLTPIARAFDRIDGELAAIRKEVGGGNANLITALEGITKNGIAELKQAISTAFQENELSVSFPMMSSLQPKPKKSTSPDVGSLMNV